MLFALSSFFDGACDTFHIISKRKAIEMVKILQKTMAKLESQKKNNHSLLQAYRKNVIRILPNDTVK